MLCVISLALATLLDPNALGGVRATAALVAKVLYRIGWDSAVQVNIGQNAPADKTEDDLSQVKRRLTTAIWPSLRAECSTERGSLHQSNN